MKKTLILLLMSSVTFLMASGTSKLIFETFEGTFPPTGWSLQTTGGGFTKSANRPYKGTYSMIHTGQGTSDDWVTTPLISIDIYDSVKVTFWENIDYDYHADVHDFCVSTDKIHWTSLYSDLPPEDTYQQVTISLDAYMGQDVYLGWNYANTDGDDWYIDDVIVTGYFGDFTDIEAGIDDVSDSSVAWGDYDNDGDLDILLTGITDLGFISKVYRNDNGVFSDINAALTGVSSGSVSWGDYDNDGDLDVVLSGYTGSVYVSKIYRNDSGIFTDINAGLPGAASGSVAWGDYDNDGDLDLVLSGYTESEGKITKIYRNDSGSFFDINAGLQGAVYSSVSWGDYDNDGDLDLLLTGSITSGNISKVYRNDNGVFSDINAALTGVSSGSVSWGDYDNDGDLDILLTGYYYEGTAHYISKIYRNDSGIFNDVNAVLQGVWEGSAAWGDYDNDGDLDILLTGSYYTKIYSNNSGVFTDINAGLVGVEYSSAAWGDYDNDGDLDILLSGDTGGSGSISKIYRNNSAPKNTPPSAPTGLSVVSDRFDATLTWNKSTDAQTPQDGLSYNLYISTTSGNDEIKSSMSDASNGYRKVVSLGNINQNTSYTIHDLRSGTYYWSVQAVDNGFAGSVFGTEQSFTFVGAFDDIEAGLMGATGSTEWGDYDNDGDLDILLTGYTGSGDISKIYRNDSGLFYDINAGLEGVYASSVAWGDYDNDGDLDILLTGYTGSGDVSKIYRNDSGVFTDINAGLEDVTVGAVAWGDYDNDGDLDILLTGYANSGMISNVYRNDSGTYTDINAGLIEVSKSSVDWGDYDNDGDLDILLTGNTGSEYISKIYRNDSGQFTDIGAGLAGVFIGSAVWGDYDNDGDLDVLLAGGINSDPYSISEIYQNNSGVFTDINAGLTGVSLCSAAWGDFDNDGDLDIILAGDSGSGYVSKVYRNDSGVFNGINTGITGIRSCHALWGDYDNDGDLDILIEGNTESDVRITKIYRNNSEISNTIPSKPSRLITKIENDSLKLSFNPALDLETPQNGLSYNIDVQVTGESINAGMSDLTDGYRKVVDIGNASQNTFYNINGFYTFLPQGGKTVSWKVQAIDHAFAGSEFASSPTFVIPSPRDLEITSKDGMTEADMLQWEYVYPEYLDYYVIQIDEDPEFSNPIEETMLLDKNSGSKITNEGKTFYIGQALNSLSQFDSLVNNTTYYWRMKPVYLGINRFTIFSETPASFIYKPTTGGSLPNAPISGFSPANDDIADSSPMISWGNATDPDGHAEDLRYTIELDSVNTFSSVLFSDTTEAGETFTQLTPSLDGGYRYYYHIKTIDADSQVSDWSAIQSFITVIPPSGVSITDDGANVNLTWDEMPINTKGIVYTVYSSEDPEAVFPASWTAVGLQLTTNSWSEPHSDSKKFYRVTAGSSSKGMVIESTNSEK
ncbi:MAG: VCBS repeat-containing protein [Candidatus Delongbacteria bacterium]|nr:VCBS repeat-containing protein [Candidatus Delongbacteria bacterium]